MAMAVCGSTFERIVVKRCGIDTGVGQEETDNVGVSKPSCHSDTVVVSHRRVGSRVCQQGRDDVCVPPLGGPCQGAVLHQRDVKLRVGREDADGIGVAVDEGIAKDHVVVVSHVDAWVAQEDV